VAPLAGVTVVEIGADVGLRYCGRLFAALGAEVLRPAGERDDRRLGYAGAAGEAYGRWLDEHKIERAPADLLTAPCDLVIGGQDRASVAEAERLATEHRDRPPLLALNWFAPDGPYGNWTGTDEVMAALNGVAFPFGEAAGPPTLAQGHAPQITAGLTAFNAALGALLMPAGERPARIDVYVHEASLTFCETGALTARATGGAAVRLGVNRFVPTYPCSPYRSADGWMGVTCLTPAQWRALCDLIDRPELAFDPRFAASYDRLMIADEVDDILREAFPRRTSAEWLALSLQHRIPITPMPRPGELPSTPHWAERGAFAPFGTGEVQGPTVPYRIAFDGAARPRWTGEGEGPLAGLRVVDFTMGWSGPLCARTLGDLGADVIKIESETHPDWWRGWEAGAVERSTREVRHNFIGVNRNKRGVDIDLTTPQGLAQAKALIAGADVVIENYAAGVLAKLGLSPAVQRALRPGIVSVSMPAFGNGGPLSGLRAYGSTVEQASGMPFVNGEAHWPPAQQHIAFGDPVAGLFAASAVLAALAARDRLGGAEIDLAQVACLFQLGADAIIAEQVMGAPVPRSGSARTRLPFCAVLPAAGEEAWVAVAAQDQARLNAVVGGSGPAAVAAWVAARPAGQAAAELQAAGVAAAPIKPSHVLCDDPQLNAAGYWCEMDRAFVGLHLNPAPPFRYDGRRPALRCAAPTLGQHTTEVLAELAAADPV
jgi:crotonobetainyl-CoA:carnitine CoA-transferase CaiB-like acyl-CoA transferase